MKKTILLTIIAIAATFTSCKKSYSCECTSSFTETGYGTYSETTIDAYSEKMKEKQAIAACKETESKLSYANAGHAEDIEYLTGDITTVSTSCEVK